MIRIILIATIALAVAVLVIQLRHWRATRHTSLVLLLTIPSLALGLPEVYGFVDAILGVPALPQLIQHLLLMFITHRLQRTLLRVIVPAGRIRVWHLSARLVLLVSMAALICLYVAGPLADRLPDVSVRRAPASLVAQYQLVLSGYVTVTVTVLSWLSIRHRRSTEDRTIRAASLLVAVGGVLGCLTVLHRLTHLGVIATGHVLPWQESGVDGVEVYAAGPALACMVTGATLPNWYPRLRTWWSHYRAYQALRPLWLAIYQADSDIALLGPRSALAERIACRRLRFHLHRRVVEIRDAMIGPLRPHLDPDIYDSARRFALTQGHSEETATAIGEATCMAAALDALTSDRTPMAHDPAPLHGEALDLTADAQRLARTSHQFRRITAT